MPRFLPFCCFLYLVRFGCNMILYDYPVLVTFQKSWAKVRFLPTSLCCYSILFLPWCTSTWTAASTATWAIRTTTWSTACASASVSTSASAVSTSTSTSSTSFRTLIPVATCSSLSEIGTTLAVKPSTLISTSASLGRLVCSCVQGQFTLAIDFTFTDPAFD